MPVPKIPRAIAPDDEHSETVVVVEADGTWRNVARGEHLELDLRHFDWLVTARAKVTGDEAAMHAYSQLVAVLQEVCEVGHALARGEDVIERIGTIYRAAAGIQEETEDRRRVVIAVSGVARVVDQQWSELIGRPVDDATLTELVCRQLETGPRRDVAQRLRQHPVAVATAVRLWRRKPGRPRKGESVGSKAAALAKVLQLGGLGRLDEKTVEQLIKEHPLKIG